MKTTVPDRTTYLRKLQHAARALYVALLLLTLVLLPFVVSTEPTLAAGNITPPCDLNSSEPCEPPRLNEVQYLVTRLIYTAWAFGGVVFMVLLVVIGGIYLTSAGDPQKVETAKKRAGQWVIGVFLYFLAQPLTATLMRGLVSGDANCFANLQDPGFTFFFPNVCDVQEVPPTSEVPGITPGAACSGQQNSFYATLCNGRPSDTTASGQLDGNTITCYCRDNTGVCQSVIADNGSSPLCTDDMNSHCASECTAANADSGTLPVLDYPDTNDLLICNCSTSVCFNFIPGN